MKSTKPPLECEQAAPYTIGAKYFIRTVTHALTGRLEWLNATELVLTTAAWIADTGRYSQAVASGEFDEVEPYPPHSRVIVGRTTIIDAVEIPILPTTQK